MCTVERSPINLNLSSNCTNIAARGVSSVQWNCVRLPLVQQEMLDYWCLWAPLPDSFLAVSSGKRCAHSPPASVTGRSELPSPFPHADSAIISEQQRISIWRRVGEKRRREGREGRGIQRRQWDGREEGERWEEGWGLASWKSIIKRSWREREKDREAARVF